MINPIDKSNFEEVFFELVNVPVYCNLLWPSAEAAKNCPKGDIRLAFDKRTGLITNIAFDPAKLGYDQNYDNSLHYSPRFQQYANTLADELVKHHQLYHKKIIEIGCGQGDFLFSLCELGNNWGIGFDPAYVAQSEHQSMLEKIEFIQDYYSEKYQDYRGDFIVCRHTLEHIPNPADLLEPLKQAIYNDPNVTIFFEVPNALYTFDHLGVWDIIYEHCCYFTPTSLKKVFSDFGFRVLKIREMFEGQFIGLEAVPVEEKIINNPLNQTQIDTLSKELATFKTRFENFVITWQEKLEEIAQTNKKIVIWGTGSKGVTFLNILHVQEVIKYAVDINPRKQGKYVPGSGQQIVSPKFLEQYQPEVVLVMNPIYKQEIHQTLIDLGCNSQLILV